MKKIVEKITQFIENFKNVHAEARKIGFAGVMRLLWNDLFVGRSLFQWLYLIVLSSVPLILEFTQNTESHDWIGLFASWTGIVCVILVAEGRASNYLFGAINSAIYLVLSMNATFYGEVLTTVYFFVMQPIGLYTWLSNRINEQGKPEESHFEAKKLGLVDCLMTRLYREQWIFWIATNLFSIYLWWGENIHIQGMYWVYTLNSLVGWYQWTKAVKEG